MDGIYKDKPKVVNLGIKIFYDALVSQQCECTRIEWMPQAEQTEDIIELLDELL